MNVGAKISLCLLFIVASLGLAVFFKIPKPISIAGVAIPFAFFCVAVAALSVISVTPIETGMAIPSIFAASVAFPIARGLSVGAFVLTAGYLAASLIFLQAVRQDRKERIKVSVSKHIEAGLGMFLFIFFMAASAFVYISSVGNATGMELIPDKVYDIAVGVSGQYLGCDMEGTFDKCVDTRLEAEIKTYMAGDVSQCAGLSPTDEATCRGQIAGLMREQYKPKVRDSLAAQFNITASTNQTISDILKGFLKEKAREVVGQFEPFVPAVMATLAFSFLNLLAFPAAVLLKILAQGIFFLLVATKLVEKNTVTAEIEVLE
jgi:hypothetical protein